jgi:hypothetical protein
VLTYTHTQLECTLRKTFLNHTQRAIQWNGGWCIFSLVSLPLWNWIFVTHPLTWVVATFRGKSQPPYLPPPSPSTGGFLHFTQSAFLCCSPSWSIWLARKLSRCSTSLIPRAVSHTRPTALWTRSPRTTLSLRSVAFLTLAYAQDCLTAALFSIRAPSPALLIDSQPWVCC